MKLAELARLHPHLFLLSVTDVAGVCAYLTGRGLLEASDRPARVTRAGDGNMNCTMRVETPHVRLIVKQARPWVEKYDHIAAPWDRSNVEAAFYRIAVRSVAGSWLPRLVHADPENRILVIEDVGARGDLTGMYRGETITPGEIDQLLAFLAALHDLPVAEPDRWLLANTEMRALNHEHMFRVPFAEPNGLVLDAITGGLQALADELKRDSAVVASVHRLGDRYLASGASLVHGDFFPGSWLRGDNGICVIDPEFCFLGCRELDYGVLLAHLALAGQKAHLQRLLARPVPSGCDPHLVRQFAGVEIIRRLIGVAQLPLDASLTQKAMLLRCAREWVLS